MAPRPPGPTEAGAETAPAARQAAQAEPASPGNPGSPGGNPGSSGGGGGGAAGGGTGGNGGGTSGAAAGAGGATPGAAGQAGGDNSVAGNGGGGGGGGANGNGAGATSITNSAPLAGGAGGRGGNGATTAGGGGGGAGGYGAIVTGAGASSNSSSITGGSGMNGGTSGTGHGGDGGSGGVGVQFTTSGASFTNLGSVSGGAGGAGGAAGGGTAGTAGLGGAGISGSGLTIINSGTISGGAGGAPAFGGFGIIGSDLTIINSGTITGQAVEAIIFNGGTNVLELRAGSTINGAVLNAAPGNNTLRLGGSTNSSFDTSLLGGGFNAFNAVEKTGTSTWTLTGTTGAATPWTITAGTLALSSGADISSSSSVTVAGGATFDMTGNVGFTSIQTLAGGGIVQLGGGLFVSNASSQFSGAINGGGGLEIGAGTLTLSGVNGYTNATQIDAGATLALTGNGSIASAASVTFSGGGTFDISQVNSGGTSINALVGNGNVSLGSKTLTITSGSTFDGVIQDGGIGGGTGGGLLIAGGGSGQDLRGVNTYTGATTITAGGLLTLSNNGSIAQSSGVNLAGAGAQFDISAASGARTIKDLSGVAGSTIQLGNNALIVGTANSTTFAGILDDSSNPGGSLVKQGSGTLTLTGANTYSGGTTISGGMINFAALNNFGTGMITLAGGGLQWAAGTTTDVSSRLVLGAGGATLDTNGSNITFANGLTGTGGLTKQGNGILNLAGANTYTGPTAVNGGTLAVNGSLTSNVTVGAGGTLGGNGTIAGIVTNNGTLAPGNSIGTLNVSGSLVQGAGSIYQVEVNAAGQGDRINVTGAPGTATINGGTVQVIAAAGSYGASTTYTILNATGGVTGTYTGVTSNFAFLTPSLAYDANNVFLTLALSGFSFGGNTPNQKAVGAALDQSYAGASGDFATVLGAMAGLSTTQGPIALDAISGQPYADFGTMNTNNSAMFMNALGQQMAMARGASATGQRQALAQACDIAACDGASSPLSAWVSALGGLGSVLGDSNASTLTYNFGGAAAGLDYRLDPRFLVGIGAGYTHGTQWVNSFLGQGWSDSVSVAAYGSFTQSGLYLDALAGYAYFNNQLQRQILIPGLQQRTASGSTGANQFLGQAEGGYKLGLYAPAAATITPFGRLQVSSVTQNAFSESGAQSLSLNVAQQTTNSLRTTLGADLASSIGLGNARTLDLALRLGWQHEFADTGRPITAAFAGAPGNSFTVFGATPIRDSAILGFSATTAVADATQIYLRYDDGVGGGTDNHALTAGLRMSW